LSALKCSFEASAFSYCIVSAPLLPCWSKTDQWNLHSPCVLYKSKRNCELQYAIPLGMLLSYSLRMMLWFVYFFFLLACNKHLSWPSRKCIVTHQRVTEIHPLHILGEWWRPVVGFGLGDPRQVPRSPLFKHTTGEDRRTKRTFSVH